MDRENETSNPSEFVDVKFGGRCCKILPQILPQRHQEPELERQYQMTLHSIRFMNFRSYMFVSLIHGLICFALNLASGDKLNNFNLGLIAMMVCAILLDLCLILCSIHLPLRVEDPSILFLPLTLASWFVFNVQIFLQMKADTYPISFASATLWITLSIFVSLVLMPVNLTIILSLNFITILLHCVFAAVNTKEIFSPGYQVGSNTFVFVSAASIGVFINKTATIRLRYGFFKARKSLKVQKTIERESQRQEELLLSVLPKHVATEMLSDFMKQKESVAAPDQFRKIYLYRHENVSILFADIVGFTNLSSIVTAGELIVILNELFASFDKLSQKYRQLRIKILGDCYYCICGAPETRQDHAVLAIHMGLSMVEEIGQVRRRTQSDVDMRVGIHTGAVLGGVIGQLRWQFDVLGKEVTIANKMESSGLPGRVHISSYTCQFLNGEFELEIGKGETREEAIKRAGLKTYFVKSVLKPFPMGTQEENLQKNGAVSNGHIQMEVKDAVSHSNDELQDSPQNSEYNEDLHFQTVLNHLTKEIRTRWHHQLHPITLMFTSEQSADYSFTEHKKKFISMCFFATGLVVSFSFFAQCFVIKVDAFTTAFFVLNFVTNFGFSFAFMGLLTNKIKWSLIVKLKEFLKKYWQFTPVMVFVSMCCNMIKESFHPLFCHGGLLYPTIESLNNTTKLLPGTGDCLQIWYFDVYFLLCCLSISCFDYANFFIQAGIIFVFFIIYILILLINNEKVYARVDKILDVNFKTDIGLPTAAYSVSYLFGTVVALMNFIRQREISTRCVYLWILEMLQQQKEATDIRSKNEQLLYNILPSHVARDFLGQSKQHDELYSRQHDFVGVMFVACPNFNDFYSEDSINNNGLECLRFLNEIISDYDELLKETRFHSISKIKTVGSTLMVASGLNTELTNPEQKNLHLTDKWSHLDDLVKYAFALQEVIARINEESFNHFMLRIGINHGSVLAGVIGARKPHYDIWGNTVNVASRMESTGELGKMQVVEECMLLLQQFSYTFEKRGVVAVKGKGNLTTYFLTGVRETSHNQLMHQYC